MSDLISRSALIEKLEKATFSAEVYNDDDFDGSVIENLLCLGDVKEIAEELPTVEAKHVVHGKWEQRTEWDEDNNAIFECTNCRHGDVQAKGVEVPYCWYCGADMRGEKHD